MAETVEVRAFMRLADLFRERHWSNPREIEITKETAGTKLLQQLDIPAEKVAVIFVNGKALQVRRATIRPGDRVALAPPGVPSHYASQSSSSFAVTNTIFGFAPGRPHGDD